MLPGPPFGPELALQFFQIEPVFIKGLKRPRKCPVYKGLQGFPVYHVAGRYRLFLSDGGTRRRQRR